MKKIALCYDFDGTLCSGYMKIKNLFQIVKNNYEENSEVDILIKNIIKA